MEKRAKIYKFDKLLKYSNAVSRKGEFFHLFTVPKNFRKNLDEAEQVVAKQKSKKKKITNLIFFLINIVIISCILGYQIINSADMSFATLLNSGFSFSILLVMLLVWCFIMFIDALRTNLLVIRSTGRSRHFLSYKVDALGRYYDSITPMGSGGQPFQIFYLSSRGLNASAAISVPMGRYVIGQISTLIIWVIIFLGSFSIDLGENFAYIRPLCVIGLVVNLLLILLVAFLSINQRVGKKIVAWSLKLLQKIKIIKNYEKQYNKVIKVVTDFQVTIKNFTKSKGTFIALLLCSVLYSICMYSMPFLVYSVMVGFFDFSMWWQLFMLGVLIDMASSVMPLPGGSGVSELSFTALFAVVFGANNSALTWALILWRFMGYYIYIIQGLIVLCYDKIIGDKKYLWQKKKLELENESINFTNDKLQEYTQSKRKQQNKKLI